MFLKMKTSYYILTGFVVIVFVLGACYNNHSQKKQSAFTPLPGDILFQDLECGPLCDAIEAVTQGYKGSNLSHMGLVVKNTDGNTLVLEAIGAGVVETPISEFLSRSSDSDGNPKVFVARVKKKYRSIIPTLIKEKERYLGLPYNNEYILNDSSFYCSQLIYVLFKEANGGNDFFSLEPMTFKIPESNSFYEAWEEYYQKQDCKIPEGMPGINPGGISCSDKIKVVHRYGVIDGMSN